MSNGVGVGIEVGGTNISVATGAILDDRVMFFEDTIVSERIYTAEGNRGLTAQVFRLRDVSLDKAGADKSEVNVYVTASTGQPTADNYVADSANVNFVMRFPARLATRGQISRIINDVLGGAFGAKAQGYGATEFANQDSPRIDAGLVIGTGTNLQMIMDGVPVTNHGGRSFEIGHQLLYSKEDGRLCGCGSRGCAEAYIAGSGIRTYASVRLAELFKQHYKHDGKAILKEQGILKEAAKRLNWDDSQPVEILILNLDAVDVFKAYNNSKGKDMLSKKIVEGAINDLAMYFGNLMPSLPGVPYVEVFGSIPENNPWYVERAVERLHERPDYAANTPLDGNETQFKVTNVDRLGLKGAVEACGYFFRAAGK